MNNKKLLSVYGLKWNPFASEVPTEALLVTPKIESFCWRVENLARQGGFAHVYGEPGTGKSGVLRMLAARLRSLPDVCVGVLTRPQAHTADFYRELGDLFGVPLTPHNRWAGAKALRQRWQTAIEQSLCRPVLLVDEGQEMLPSVLNELRLLASTELDARQILTVVLCGDSRLTEKLRQPELLPVASRIRTRLHLEPVSPEDLLACLQHALAEAGNPKLITAELMTVLCEHALGTPRALMNLADELLAAAMERQLDRIDEKLFFDVHGQPLLASGKTRKAGAR